MIVGSVSLKFVLMLYELRSQYSGVVNHLLGICLELRLGGQFQRNGDSGNRLPYKIHNIIWAFRNKLAGRLITHVVMRTALARRENGHVHAVFDVLRPLAVLSEENQPSTGSAKGLVAK